MTNYKVLFDRLLLQGQTRKEVGLLTMKQLNEFLMYLCEAKMRCGQNALLAQVAIQQAINTVQSERKRRLESAGMALKIRVILLLKLAFVCCVIGEVISTASLRLRNKRIGFFAFRFALVFSRLFDKLLHKSHALEEQFYDGNKSVRAKS